MCSNPTKVYFTTGSGSTFGSAFIKEAIILLKYYNIDDNILWSAEYDSDYALLKSVSRNYQKDTLAYTLVQLIDNLNSSIIVINNLRSQVTILEETLALEHNASYNILVSGNTLQQNAQLNKVYIQYMLLFNLSATNNIFIPSNLDQAQALLDANAGRITMPVAG